jgi:hypothetical protein
MAAYLERSKAQHNALMAKVDRINELIREGRQFTVRAAGEERQLRGITRSLDAITGGDNTLTRTWLWSNADVEQFWTRHGLSFDDGTIQTREVIAAEKINKGDLVSYVEPEQDYIDEVSAIREAEGLAQKRRMGRRR